MRCENETGEPIGRPCGWATGIGSNQSRTSAIATTLPMTIRVGKAGRQVSMDQEPPAKLVV